MYSYCDSLRRKYVGLAREPCLLGIQKSFSSSDLIPLIMCQSFVRNGNFFNKVKGLARRNFSRARVRALWARIPKVTLQKPYTIIHNAWKIQSNPWIFSYRCWSSLWRTFVELASEPCKLEIPKSISISVIISQIMCEHFLRNSELFRQIWEVPRIRHSSSSSSRSTSSRLQVAAIVLKVSFTNRFARFVRDSFTSV